MKYIALRFKNSCTDRFLGPIKRYDQNKLGSGFVRYPPYGIVSSHMFQFWSSYFPVGGRFDAKTIR